MCRKCFKIYYYLDIIKENERDGVMAKQCVLEDRPCNDCGECMICDLDRTKICDNCCKCIDSGADYAKIDIDEIIDE
jgi:hypothetical protein